MIIFTNDVTEGAWLYSKSVCVSDITSVHITLAYKSCAELFDAGFTEDGVYQILSDKSEIINIYCDQSSWGGGKKWDQLKT